MKSIRRGEVFPPVRIEGRFNFFACFRIQLAISTLLGLLAAGWVVWLKVYWFRHAPEGWVFFGYLQGDQKIYAALIHQAAKSSNGFTYAFPWDFSEHPPEIFFQLPIALTAWASRLFPSVALHDLFDAFRLIFGAAMFWAMGRVIHLYAPSRRIFWFVLTVAGFGGGIAWIPAATRWISHANGGLIALIESLRETEGDYTYWSLSLFRNLFYPFELFYHFLFFFMIVALLRAQRGLALTFYALGMASNPFLGAQMTALLLPALILDMAKTKFPRRFFFSALSFVPLILFLAYDKLFLSHWEIGRNVQDQQLGAHQEPLSMRGLILGHGPMIAVFLISWLNAGFRKRQWKSRGRRILLIWILGTFVLTQNSRFLFQPIQPMHFTRGNLFFPLILWGAQFLEFIGHRSSWRKGRGWLIGLGIAALLLLPDNFLFALMQSRFIPTANDLIYTRSAAEVVEYLKHGKGRVYAHTFSLSKLICAETGRQTYWEDEIVTPQYKERQADLGRWLADGDFENFEKKYDVSVFVLSENPADPKEAALDSRVRSVLPAGRFSVRFKNSEYAVMERP